MRLRRRAGALQDIDLMKLMKPNLKWAAAVRRKPKRSVGADFHVALTEAKASVKEGIPFLINAVLEKSDFRKGSLSM